MVFLPQANEYGCKNYKLTQLIIIINPIIVAFDYCIGEIIITYEFLNCVLYSVINLIISWLLISSEIIYNII